MTKHDPFELLSAYSALVTADLPGPNSPTAADSLRHILASKRPRYLLPSKRALRIAIAVTIAVGAIAATYIATRVEPPVGARVSCRTTDELETVSLGYHDNPLPEVCGSVWADERIAEAAIVPGVVPPLVGCVHSSGTVWVYPTDDDSICAHKGLSIAEYGETNQGASPTAAMDEIIKRLERPSCLTQDQAIDLAREIIKSHKLKKWEVRSGDFRPGECAAPAFDPKEKLITISSA